MSDAKLQRVNSTSSETSDFKEEEGQKIYNVSKSRLVRLINWFHVIGLYLPIIWYVAVGSLIIQILKILFDLGFDFKAFYMNEMFVLELEKPVVFALGWKAMLVLALLIWYFTHRQKPVYLLDFATFQPPESWRLSPEQIFEILQRKNCFTEESLEFQKRMLQQSGCGPKTAWPPGIVQVLEGKEHDSSIESSRKESEIVMFDVVEKALKKAGVKPKEIDFLIVNCSLFSPTPSLCSMIINHFGMKTGISSYNLSGMGCSASLISIELAKNLLNSRANSKALVVSTEIITPNLYCGNERGFLLQNLLFRCGGAAIVLSNSWSDAYRANFKLLHVVRTQYVSEDSFGCVYETEDETRLRGVRLSKDIVKVAGRAMERNFTTLGPYVLPISEQLKTVFSMVRRMIAKKLNLGKVDPYIPDFKRGLDHFCIHAGGRGVIDGIEKNLNLTPRHVEASRHALYTYGNTSSSSIWYELDYIRNNMDLKRGQRVLQVAFGSGFKCNSGVWLCINPKSSNKKALKDDDNKKHD